MPSQDRLLKSTTVAIKGILLLISVVIAIGLIVLLPIFLAQEGAGILGARKHAMGESVSAIEVSLAFGVPSLVMLLLILRGLRRIVDSALTGDPFVPANAQLLRQIGWLALGINSAQIIGNQIIFNLGKPLAPVELWIAEFSSIPWLGFFATLLIFVLARVFQRGSEMRADLEGTV
jgi:hypothetical protein